MKILLSFLISYSLFLAPCLSQGTWTPRDSLPDTARGQGISGFSIGNYGYAGLGQDVPTNHYFNDLWEFDPSNDSWIQKANFPGEARVAPACFVIGHYAYIVTGSVDNGGTCLTECWQYNAENNTWTQKANFPGPARTYAVGFAIGGKGYVGTGANELTDFRKDFYVYDTTTNTWARIADFPGIARSCACGFAVGGKGYVCFGQDSLFSGDWLKKDMWEYDTGTKIWTQKSNCPGLPMYCASGFAICDNIYVGSGNDSDVGFNNTFWKYNTTLDSWIQETSILGITKLQGAAFAIGDTGYYGFGFDSVGIVYNIFDRFFGGDSCNINTGFAETKNDLKASIYPNPTNKILSVDFNGVQSGLANLSIIDIAGREVINRHITLNNSGFSIDVSFLSSGMYFVNIAGSDVNYSCKFIKM